MTLLEEVNAEPQAESDPARPRLRPWFAAAVLVLCGLLIFAHFGCHGDEDNELFSLVRASSVSPKRNARSGIRENSEGLGPTSEFLRIPLRVTP